MSPPIGLGLALDTTLLGRAGVSPAVTGYSQNFISGSTTGTPFTVSRATSAQVTASNGALSSVSANALRLGYDELFLDNAGLLIEGALTQGIASPDFTGVTNGVVGSGGALPTNWSIGAAANLTLTVSNASATSFDLTLAGTSNATSARINTNTTQAFATVAGDTTTGSFWVQEVANSNVTNRNIFIETNTAAGAVVARTTQAFPASTDTPWPAQYILAISGGTVAFSRTGLQWGFSNGATINATYRIQRPLYEKLDHRATTQPSASRAADVVTRANASAYPLTQTVLWREARNKFDHTVWQWSKDSSNYIAVRVSGWAVYMTVVSGGVTLTDTKIGTTTMLARNQFALSVNSTGIAASLNGKTAQTASLTPPAGLTTEQLGGGQYGYLYGYVETAVQMLVDTGAASLPALAAITSDVFECYDFYADGAYNQNPPSGQTLVKVPANGSNIVLSTIASGKSVATNTSYDQFDLGSGRVTQLLSFSASWASGANTLGVAAIIGSPLTPGNTTNITNQSWHTKALVAQINTGYYESGVITDLATQTFTQVTQDSATLYSWAVAQVGGASITIDPYGAQARFTTANLVSDNGRYVTFEHSSTSNQSQFAAIAAR